jgi:hypothetical protein
MIAKARRLLLRRLPRLLRRAALALCVVQPSLAVAQNITDARYTDPTTRYAHGILGDAIEHGTLRLQLDDGRAVNISLPQSDVFEDTQPRLADLNGDGKNEVIVVQSNARLGAKLAIYGANGRVADTPNIGRANRWLAPLGAADLDQNGIIDVAYIDRPHLAKILRIWRFEDGELKHSADLAGYTNHRIGERDIAGGIRTCNGTPEMIVATADWRELVAITFDGADFDIRILGENTSRAAFARAMACKA